MKPETEAFVNLVRDLDDVTPKDEERVKRSLDAALAAGATASVLIAVPSTLAKTAWGNSWLSACGVSASTLGKACAIIAVGAAGYAAREVWVQEPARPSSVLPGAASVSQPARPSARPLPTELARQQASAPAPEVTRTVEHEPAKPAPRRSSVSPASADSAVSPASADSARALPSTAAPANQLSEELRFLQRVQAALKRGRPELALKLLDEHRTADRQLAVERRALRVLALCAAGNSQAARAERRAFLRDHPASVHHDAIRKACARPR